MLKSLLKVLLVFGLVFSVMSGVFGECFLGNIGNDEYYQSEGQNYFCEGGITYESQEGTWFWETPSSGESRQINEFSEIHPDVQEVITKSSLSTQGNVELKKTRNIGADVTLKEYSKTISESGEEVFSYVDSINSESRFERKIDQTEIITERKSGQTKTSKLVNGNLVEVTTEDSNWPSRKEVETEYIYSVIDRGEVVEKFYYEDNQMILGGDSFNFDSSGNLEDVWIDGQGYNINSEGELESSSGNILLKSGNQNLYEKLDEAKQKHQEIVQKPREFQVLSENDNQNSGSSGESGESNSNQQETSPSVSQGDQNTVSTETNNNEQPTSNENDNLQQDQKGAVQSQDTSGPQEENYKVTITEGSEYLVEEGKDGKFSVIKKGSKDPIEEDLTPEELLMEYPEDLLNFNSQSYQKAVDSASEQLSADPNKLYEIQQENPNLYSRIDSDNKNKLESYQNGEWNGIEDTSTYSKIPLSSDGIKNILVSYDGLSSQENLDDKDKKTIQNMENSLKLSIAENSVNFATALSELENENLRTKISNGFNEKSCDGFFSCLGSFFSTTVSAEQKLAELFKKEISTLDINDENYNTKLNTRTSEVLTSLFGEDQFDSCSSIDTCQENLEKVTCSTEACEANKAAAKKVLNAQYQNQALKTNIFFDIVTAITNPDYNAVKAAKLFGAEANFDNVPFFLKEEIPSQICIAKIEGYLDKDREAGGGLTRYGCTEDKEPYYDFDTGRLLNGVNPNCVEVIADIRAQRTRVTPDGRTSISYSYFLQAPKHNKITYLVAISYTQGGSTQKLPIIETQELNNNSVGKGFDQVSIPLNITNGEVDENSFQIGIISVFEDRRPYVSLTYPIVLIDDGDYYFELVEGTGNSAGNSQANNLAQNPQNSLDTQDLLQLFN